jgi:AcrR family transcriptional regulator
MAILKTGLKTGVRELQKHTRRRAILDAARSLILDGNDRDFSMPVLAEKAGVSLVTPYNLFGSKSSILLEIVREDIFARIADIDALARDSLVDWIGALSRTLAAVYYRNRHFYRRMIVTLVAQESAEEQRAALELTYRMFEAPLTRLQEEDALSSAVPAAILARHLAHGISGSLQHRLMERGSEEHLQRDIEMALLLLLGGLAAAGEREHLLGRVAVLSQPAE